VLFFLKKAFSDSLYRALKGSPEIRSSPEEEVGLASAGKEGIRPVNRFGGKCNITTFRHENPFRLDNYNSINLCEFSP